jgi:hypothetical protein
MNAPATSWYTSPLDVTIRLSGVLWAVWLMVPWSPAPFAQGPLDEGYTIFSHIAFAKGTPWGAGALHTTGALGFLRFPFFYHQTFALLLLGLGLLAATLALLIDEGVRHNLPTWLRLPTVFGTTWLLSFNDDAGWVVVLLASQVLLPRVVRSRHWSVRPATAWLTWPILLDLAVCAVAANVKGTFLLMAGVVATEIAVLELWGRRAPILSMSFIVVIGLISLLSGFRIQDWGSYLQHILGSLSGYPEGFSKPGSPVVATLLLSSVLAFLALAAASGSHPATRLETIVRWTALALLLWIVGKGALVRQDRTHEIRAIMSVATFFVLFVATQFRNWSVKTKITALLPALSLASLIVLPKSEPPPPPRAEAHQHIEPFLSFLKSGTAAAVTRDAQARREVAKQVEHPWASSSSVAVFGTYQSLALGHPGRYVQMPIIAPYEVWTTWTSRRERDFLIGPDAPDYILYTTSPTSAEVALALTAHYVEHDRGLHYRLLRRRVTPFSVRKRLVLERDVEAGETIEIPPAWRTGPAIAQVDYTKTPMNTLISTIYQPPEAFLVLLKGRTPLARVRMNMLLSPEGIVLASRPGVWDGSSAALHGIRFDLLTDEQTEATALAFEARGVAGNAWSHYFGRRIHLRIYIPDFHPDTIDLRRSGSPMKRTP